jgi:hypothetical protein
MGQCTDMVVEDVCGYWLHSMLPLVLAVVVSLNVPHRMAGKSGCSSRSNRTE